MTDRLCSVVLFWGVLCILATAPCPVSAQTGESARILVKFRSTGAPGQAQAQSVERTPSALARRTGLSLQRSRQLAARLHAMELAGEANETLEQLLARLRSDPAIEYAEPDRRRRLQAMPNDPLFDEQWYLKSAEAAAIHAEEAWDLTTGGVDIVVAVLDTGVRFEHPDLRRIEQGGRLLPGFDFVSRVAAANDGNGWDDDPSDPGDWVSENDVRSPAFRGCEVSPNSSWHGTRVAGIIGARTNNAQGVAGITWGVRLLPVRVLGKCGGWDSDIIPAMRWAAGIAVSGVPPNRNPARIINMSLGSEGVCSQAYRDVISELNDRGVLVVVSAGNDTGRRVTSPANCPGVLAVAGVRHVGTKVGFSNIGPEVAIAAPGGNCVNLSGPCLYSLHTTTNAGSQQPTFSTYTNAYNYNVGTSFSAPIVAGVAALVRSVNSRLTPQQTILRLQDAATPFPILQGLPPCQDPATYGGEQLECNCTTSTCGAGIVNAAAAVAAALRPFVIAHATPVSPASGQTVSLDGSESFASDGRTITGYQWSVVSTGGATPVLTGAGLANASFVAPTAGQIILRLTVTDSEGSQDSAEVIVNTPAPDGPPTQTPASMPQSRSGGGGAFGAEILILCLLYFLRGHGLRRKSLV